MSSDPAATDTVDSSAAAPSRRRLNRRWLALLVGVIVVDIIAFIVVPPFPKGGAPGDECSFPVCFIESTLEFPAPHTVIDFDPATAPAASALVTFHPSISSTLLTMWLVIALVVIGAILLLRNSKLVPGRGQNAFEFVYEFLRDFGLSSARSCSSCSTTGSGSCRPSARSRSSGRRRAT